MRIKSYYDANSMATFRLPPDSNVSRNGSLRTA